MAENDNEDYLKPFRANLRSFKMPLLKKRSYNLANAQKNNKSSNTGTYTQIKEKP